jgi:chemotaxis protein MotB
MLGGCSIVLQKRHPSDIQRIQELKEEARVLAKAKKLLEDKLKREIGEEKVRLELAERGLVITFVAEVLFDSGKAKIREDAYPVLDKVASVLKELKGRNVGIEGHTDNEPIKYSGWRSNWELSTARATSVLHYLVDKKGLSPERISATGYGEYRPVASNDTPEGRQKNRRVEIIVMPKKIEKIGLEEFYGQKTRTKYKK